MQLHRRLFYVITHHVYFLQEYIKSPWNLNNLPLLKESVLHYISAEISGMKVTLIMLLQLDCAGIM